MREPLTVEVMRGELVESRHLVHGVIADADGQVVESWGEPDRLVFPRSSIKPIQALPLIETGAADHFDLLEAEIALACGSHSGTPGQIALLKGWLDRLGLDEAALECGPLKPMDDKAAEDLVRHGDAPTSIHNNCSGEHAGFLTTALHLGEPISGYSRVDHPVQKRVTRALSELVNCDPRTNAFATDGCGIPAIAFPLHELAIAAARLATPERLGNARNAAISRIRRSIAAEPEIFAGPKQFDTLAMRELGTKVVVKSGVEGVFLAGSFESGLGLFLKVEDGTQRARDLAAANFLKTAGFIDATQQEAFAYFLTRPLQNSLGAVVGQIRFCEHALSA